MATHYKKIDIQEFTKDTFTRPNYFNTMTLENIRYKIRIENSMVATIRKNFSRKYRNSSLSCPSCKDKKSNIKIPDTQVHVLYECEAFSHWREQLDIREDIQMIQYFKWVVEYRIKEGED